MKLHLGCGKHLLPDFINVDAHHPLADVRLDLVQDPWPWEPGSAERIESYHLIEHLTEQGGAGFLKQCFRTLAPGGTLVIECPDLEGLTARYARSRRKMRRQMFGWQDRGPAMCHRWGYCGPTMKLALVEAGFLPSRITLGPGTDYHASDGPCLRAEAVR